MQHFTVVDCEGPWEPSAKTFQYLALSYCWGDNGNLVTSPENMNARKGGISWEEIPQAIKTPYLSRII